MLTILTSLLCLLELGEQFDPLLKGNMNSSMADTRSHWQRCLEVPAQNPVCICCHPQTCQVAMESDQTFASARVCRWSFIFCLHFHSTVVDGPDGLKPVHGSPRTTSTPWETQATSLKPQWESPCEDKDKYSTWKHNVENS